MQGMRSLAIGLLLVAAGCAGGKSSSDDSATASPSAEVSGQATDTSLATAAPDATSAASPEPSTSAGAAESTASSAVVEQTGAPVTVAYTDLTGTFGADKIRDLAQLGVFGSGSTFKPDDPIKRRDFLRWMFNANNALWASEDGKQIRPAPASAKSAFTDVSASDPDFAYVQGLQDAGIAVGFPDRTARLDQVLTREQMFAVKSVLDKGGVPPGGKGQVGQDLTELPDWKDKKDIAPEFVPAITNAIFNDGQKIDNVGRVYGAIASFRPKQPVTRGEAGVLLWKIGDHQEYTGGPTSYRTAAEALVRPTATP